MCKQPIKIRNNNKYIADNTGHQLYIWVNCGKCSECRKQKETEWTLRTYYQTLKTIKEGNWLYFDTLTYSNKNLPRLNKLMKDAEGKPINKQYSCFNYMDIREFYEKLRGWYGDKAFKYFITSEYGTLRNRPHYHIILFVQDNKIDPLKFSLDVSKAWGKGRTDGRPYKSCKYVKEHNIIHSMNLNAIRYVAKYVNKSQHFENIINERWTHLENYYKRKNYNKYQIKEIKRKYFYYCTPFHRQSQHFGEDALLYMDYETLWNKALLYYKDDSLKINKYCHLPMYFKRKLTQEQIKVNGKRIWINTEIGIKWKQEQEKLIKEQIITRYKDLNVQHGKQFTEEEIEATAKYILFERGRLKGKQDYKNHINEAKHYQYNTDKDDIYIGQKGISKNYIGNDKQGYVTTEAEWEELDDQIYINPKYETIIEKLNILEDDKSKVLLKEHLAELKKTIFRAF